MLAHTSKGAITKWKHWTIFQVTWKESTRSYFYRSSGSHVFFKTAVLKNVAKVTQKHWETHLRVFFNTISLPFPVFFKKEIPAQVLSCKFWGILKNSVFSKHLQVTRWLRACSSSLLLVTIALHHLPFFKNIFKLCTFFPRFSNISLFFWKIARIPLLSRIGPVTACIFIKSNILIKEEIHQRKKHRKNQTSAQVSVLITSSFYWKW